MTKSPKPSAQTILLSLFLLSALACFSQGASAQYDDKLNDINVGVYKRMRYLPSGMSATQLPTAIGHLGRPEVVVDLRGFVPMSLASNAGRWRLTFVDTLDWFQIPTRKALLLLYSGDLHLGDVATDTTQLETQELGTTRFVNESRARGETELWCKLAYDLARNSAPIFEKLAGGGFQEAEPTTVVLTANSAFVFLNFKYGSALINHGQVLAAMEFSRNSKRYKTTYKLYSTEMLNKSASEAAVAIAPYAAKAAIAIFSGGN